MGRHGVIEFCGVAQVAVRGFHKPVVVVQVHSPQPTDPSARLSGAMGSCSQHGRAARPYKPRRAARLAATAGLDTQDYNQISRRHRTWSRCYERQLSWFNSNRRGHLISTPTDFGTVPPKDGCGCSTHSVEAISPLKHMQMCACLVRRRQLVQVQPAAPIAPQALESEGAAL